MDYEYNLIAFDIETNVKNGLQLAQQLGVICYELDDIVVYDSPNCVVEFLDETYLEAELEVQQFYAHNFSGFDSYFVVPILLYKNVEIIKLFVRNNNIIYLKCKWNDLILHFRDSYLYMSLPLREIYYILGWRKAYTPVFSKNRLLTYLAFDLIGLYYFLSYFGQWTHTTYGINALTCVTIAQFSYLNYRRNFMRKTVFFISRKLRHFFKPYFMGGKTHITKNFGRKLFFYDVNSMYPYMMLRYLPNRHRQSFFRASLDTFFGFVYVVLVYKPLNSFHCELKEGIMFSEEIKMLIKLGFVFKLKYFIEYQRARLFTRFVGHFYTMRLQPLTPLHKMFPKICMNTLYGKLGATQSMYNSLQLAMAISSYARVEMMCYKQKFFIYADTDSIVYEHKISKRYIGKKIGWLKEVAKITHGYFIPNYYLYYTKKGQVLKAKGMIKRVAPILTSLKHVFKLTYFKKKNFKIYATESTFNFIYNLNNVKYYEKRLNKGSCWLGWLY